METENIRGNLEDRIKSFLDKVIIRDGEKTVVKWKTLKTLAHMKADCCWRAYEIALDYLKKQDIITWEPHGDWGLFAAYEIPMNPMSIGGRIFYTKRREDMEQCVDALYNDRNGLYIRQVGQPVSDSAKQQ